MSGFSFQCGTCRARLVVKDEQAVGQIHPCPQCGSMVLIRQPGPSNGAPRSVHPSSPRPQDGLLDHSSLLSNNFEQVDTLLSGHGDEEEVSPFPSAGPEGGVETENRFVASPDAAASSPIRDEASAGPWRSAWIISSSALSGMVGVVLLAQWLAPQPLAVRSLPAPRVLAGEPASATTDDRQPSAADDIRPDGGDERSPPPATRVFKPAIPANGQPVLSILPDPVASVGETASAGPAAQADSEAEALPTIDSTAFDEPQPSSDARVAVSKRAAFVDARQRIGQTLESLELPQTSFGAFHRLLEQLADIPITIDPDSLAMARIDLTERMSLDVRQLRLGETLSQGLRPLHLGYRLAGPHLIVQHLAILENRPPSLSLDVQDLVEEPSTVAALASLIVECGVVTPAHGAISSLDTSDDHRLTVNAPPLVQFQVLQFLERLRIARGLATRTVYGPPLQSERPHHRRAIAAMEQAIVAQWPRHATLSQIADELQRQTQIDLLIDWPALEAADIHYQTAFQIEGSPGCLRSLLTALAQVGLSCQAMDDRTIAVTTIAQERRSGVIVFHPIADLAAARGASPQQFATLLQAALSESMARDGQDRSTRDARFVYDPASEQLIARLPASLQARLGKGLEQLRHERKMADGSLRPNSRRGRSHDVPRRRQTG